MNLSDDEGSDVVLTPLKRGRKHQESSKKSVARARSDVGHTVDNESKSSAGRKTRNSNKDSILKGVVVSIDDEDSDDVRLTPLKRTRNIRGAKRMELTESDESDVVVTPSQRPKFRYFSSDDD